MTVYYSKGHTSSGSPLAFQTPANWNTEDDATGSDATSLAGHHLIVQASHYMTLGADVACGSVRLLGTLTGNDNTITTDRATSNKPFDHDGTISGDLNVTITNTGVQADGLMLDSGHGNTGNINDLTINMANGTTANKTIGIAETCTLDGDLTITSGTFDTVFSGGSSQTLTVTGQVSVTGTLTCNESAINIGSLYITSNGVVNATNQTTTINKETSVSAVGYAVYNEGTFHHNNGLVVIGTDTSTIVYGMEGDDTSGANSNAFYRVQVELDNAAYFCKFRPQAGTVAVKIANDLTVAEGIVSQETATHSFEVDVDVSIEAGGVLGRTDITGANTFGSLTIASSGEYIATQNTTIITSTSSNYSVNNAGTFTHNNGTVKIDFETPDYNANSKIKLNQMYNLEVEMNRTTDMTLLEPESGTTLTALNNVTVKKGVLTKNSHTHTLDFKGLTVVGVGGGSLAAHIDASTSGSATSNFGSLTILTDGKYTQSTTTNVSSIRNVGGTIA